MKMSTKEKIGLTLLATPCILALIAKLIILFQTAGVIIGLITVTLVALMVLGVYLLFSDM